MTLRQKKEFLLCMKHMYDLDREVTKIDRLIALAALRYILRHDEVEEEEEITEVW